MKKYFLKWIAVEGEIKKGSRVNTPRGQGIVTLMNDKSKGTFEVEIGLEVWLFSERDVIPNKLFLCSRDISLGNQVRYGDHPEAPEHECVSLQECEANKCWKIIGEISEDAYTFAKEGMTFGEEQVKVLGVDNFGNCWDISTFATDKPVSILVKLQCSNCKHFH